MFLQVLAQATSAQGAGGYSNIIFLSKRIRKNF